MRRIVSVLGIAISLALPLYASNSEALFSGARNGDLDLVRAALAEGVPIDSVNQYGSTALSMAASNGHLEVAEYLVQEGADPNIAETFYYSRPLDDIIRELHTAGHVTFETEHR